jgi:hypothetical protein
MSASRSLGVGWNTGTPGPSSQAYTPSRRHNHVRVLLCLIGGRTGFVFRGATPFFPGLEARRGTWRPSGEAFDSHPRNPPPRAFRRGDPCGLDPKTSGCAWACKRPAWIHRRRSRAPASGFVELLTMSASSRRQRASAAPRAISARRSGDSLTARARPPLLAPRRPRATACGFLREPRGRLKACSRSPLHRQR